MDLLTEGLHTESAGVLVGTVLVVGVLHTIVPDHWLPITLIARQRAWSRTETARAALLVGIGHVVTTLVLAAMVWLVGVVVTEEFGHWVDTLSSLALVAIGLWIAVSSWFNLHSGDGHGHMNEQHGHTHEFSRLIASDGSANRIHGPALQRINSEHGALHLSIYEFGRSPRFRFTSSRPDSVTNVTVETCRDDGIHQTFALARHGEYWESLEEIPEPHEFDASIMVGHDESGRSYQVVFTERKRHDHGQSYHHRSNKGTPRKISSLTMLLLILGSSPMVEGIPVFFAAGKYGLSLIFIMALVFAASTILTYVLVCVFWATSLQRVNFGAVERHGEVLSGAFIALVGIASWMFPVL
ncbi:hypothetical protein [Paraburkholderia humisilvae]|nr:hypothetical protein [Paraburkholderia humisilvae]